MLHSVEVDNMNIQKLFASKTVENENVCEEPSTALPGTYLKVMFSGKTLQSKFCLPFTCERLN